MYNQREIILIPFPYSDLTTAKRRTALIVLNNNYNSKFNDVIVCAITSNKFIDDYSLPLKNENLEYGFMPEESVIKTHKLFTIDKNRILKKFSVIESGYFKNVIKTLSNLF